MSLDTREDASPSNECLPFTGKRSLESGAFSGVHSAKRRRTSLASVDLSRELLPQTLTEQRTKSSADRFIPARPKFLSPFNTTPRTNRLAKRWGLADERILNFSDTPSSIPTLKMHSLLGNSASELFDPPIPTPATSATAHLAHRRHAGLVLDLPNITADPLAYPMSWSTNNYIAVAFGITAYYQNLDTRKTARLWTLYNNYRDRIHALQWAGSARAGLLALGSTSGKVSLCDAGAAQQTLTWRLDSLGSACAIDWLDHYFAVGRETGEISLFDCRVKDGVKTITGHTGEVHGVRWSHDGKHLASGDKYGAVYIWDARADKFFVGGGEKGRKMKHYGPVKALAWCPWKPDLLATGSIYPEGIIRIWNATSSISPPSPIHTIALNTSVTSLHWSPHCKELLSTHGSTWSLSSNAVTPTGRLTNVASPLANSITVHAYPSCKRLMSVQAHHGVVSHSCLSPDGTSVFTVSSGDESMKKWKVWGKREDLRKRESVFDRYAIR